METIDWKQHYGPGKNVICYNLTVDSSRVSPPIELISVTGQIDTDNIYRVNFTYSYLKTWTFNSLEALAKCWHPTWVKKGAKLIFNGNMCGITTKKATLEVVPNNWDHVFGETFGKVIHENDTHHTVSMKYLLENFLPDQCNDSEQIKPSINHTKHNNNCIDCLRAKNKQLTKLLLKSA